MAKILESDIKKLLLNHKMNVPKGIVAHSKKEAINAAVALKAPYIVKALVSKGKKKKAGLIIEAMTTEEVGTVAEQLIGRNVDDFVVEKVYIEEKIVIKKELFVSFTYDNFTRSPMLLFSKEGGIEIEEVAKQHPELIFKQEIDILEGFHAFQAKNMCFKAGLSKDEAIKISSSLVSLYNFFIQSDARILEINPLSIDENNNVVVIGALLNIDDEALFRHPEFDEFASYGLERIVGDMNEREKWVLDADLAAPKSGAVRYTEFEKGEIGLLVVGGGASLTVMDVIKRSGLKAANYSDLGPGKSSQDKLKVLIKAVLSNPSVKAIITGANVLTASQVSDLASSVAEMVESDSFRNKSIPIVARWAGLNESGARKAWENVEGAIYYGSEITLEEAAEKAVELVKGQKGI